MSYRNNSSVSHDSRPTLTMVINEDGITLGLPYNEAATNIAARSLRAEDWIKGNAVLCAPGELEAADGSAVD